MDGKNQNGFQFVGTKAWRTRVEVNLAPDFFEYHKSLHPCAVAGCYITSLAFFDLAELLFRCKVNFVSLTVMTSHYIPVEPKASGMLQTLLQHAALTRKLKPAKGLLKFVLVVPFSTLADCEEHTNY